MPGSARHVPGRVIVIVHCPSCGTRYRHSEVPTGTERQARCFRCEKVFTLNPLAREYVLMDAAGELGSQAMALGDGPLESRHSVPGPAPQIPGAGLAIGMDDPTLAKRLERTGLDPGGPSSPVITYRVDVADGSPEPTAPGQQEPPIRTKGKAASFVRSLLGTLMLVNLGMVVGWTLSSRLNIEFAPVVLGGSVLGLLLAWWGVRWKTAR